MSTPSLLTDVDSGSDDRNDSNASIVFNRTSEKNGGLRKGFRNPKKSTVLVVGMLARKYRTVKLILMNLCIWKGSFSTLFLGVSESCMLRISPFVCFHATFFLVFTHASLLEFVLVLVAAAFQKNTTMLKILFFPMNPLFFPMNP